MKNERQVVRLLADSLVDRTVKKCIRSLQKLKITFSGDDRLKTTWDEICVQLQGEESFFWDDYEEAVLNFVRKEVDRLQFFEQMAIWCIFRSILTTCSGDLDQLFPMILTTPFRANYIFKG